MKTLTTIFVFATTILGCGVLIRDQPLIALVGCVCIVAWAARPD